MSLRVPVYRPTGSALHSARARVAAAYLAAPCLVAVLYDSPLVIAGTLAGIVAAGLSAGLGREIANACRFALPLVLLVALINPIVSREGLTVLVSGPVVPVLGRVDITLESLVYGLIAASRLLVVILAFAVYSAAVDPDEILRLFRRVSLRSALTASLATRLVPVLGRDAERLSDAYELRAARLHDGARLAKLRRAATLTRALTAGALERAVDVAAALEVRGFGGGSGGRPTPRPWSRHDVAFVAAALATVALASIAAAAGIAGFEPYPSLQIDAAPLDFALAAAFAALLVAPFGSWSRRG
jgi:energy-coupling factor transport system permease protein